MHGVSLVLLAAVTLAAASLDVRLDDDGMVRVINAPPGAGLALYVDTGGDLPPVAGTVRVAGTALVFEPRFPLQPGMRYRAELALRSGEKVLRTIEIPGRDVTPTTVVERVYPTADTLPENLLKFYIHFSAPVSRGEAYRRIRLLDEAGAPVELPFLELEQELWDGDGQRLTLLFDPGRIKQGLVPRTEAGLALVAGKSYTLAVDSGFLDAKGLPLKEGYRKPFRVAPEDHTPPDPATWEIGAPRAGTRNPLVVEFLEPMDRALLERVVTVTSPADRPIAGAVRIDRHETRWSFTPTEAWEPTRYILQAQTILEDLAGNSIGRPFEVDVFEKIEDQAAGKTVRLPFTPHR